MKAKKNILFISVFIVIFAFLIPFAKAQQPTKKDYSKEPSLEIEEHEEVIYSEKNLPPLTTHSTWEFTNGNSLEFLHDSNLVLFRSKDGTEKVIAEGIINAFPNHIFKNQVITWEKRNQTINTVYVHPSWGMVTVIINHKPMVITEDGILVELPFRNLKLIQNSNMSVKYLQTFVKNRKNETFCYLSFAATGNSADAFNKEKNPHLVGKLNSGETFLVRSSDGKVLWVDNRYHNIYVNPFKWGNDLNLERRSLSFEDPNEGTPINLNNFDLQVKTSSSLPELKSIVTSEGKQADPLTYVHQFAKNLREKVVEDISNGIEYEPLDPETAATFKRAFLKGELASIAVLGPAGSGKTELILRFIADILLERIQGIPSSTSFYSIDATSFSEGAKNLGSHETKIKAMVELSKSIPAFWILDEIHALRGQGTHSENSNDIFEWLKPYLSDGTLKVIGMTTPEEFYNTFTDSALLERFQIINHTPPVGDNAIETFKSWIKKKQRKMPSDAVLKLALNLSENFQAISAQPRKGIRLLNETFIDIAISDNPDREMTEKDIHDSAKRIYQLDPDTFNLNHVRKKLNGLLEELDNHVIGHESTKKMILHQATIGLTGLQEENHPRLSLLFAGPKGVGKTDLAKAYATIMGYPFVRIMMNQFNDHDGHKLILEQIHDAILKNPLTVFLLDEIDKTSKSTINALLPIFDAAQFSVDIQKNNRTKKKIVQVDVHNATFFLAGNVEPSLLNPKSSVGFQASDQNKNKIDSAEESEHARKMIVDSGISHYLVDRIIDCSILDWLSKEEFRKVIELHLNKMISKLTSKNQFSILFNEKNAFIDSITDRFYKSQMSNRAALRIMKKEVTQLIATAILNGTFESEIKLKFDSEKNGLHLDCESKLIPTQQEDH